MQAIVTKFKGPTDTKGARIIATSYAGRTVFAYDHALDAHGNHVAAAAAHVRAKLGHHHGTPTLTSGELPDSGHAHVVTFTAGV